MAQGGSFSHQDNSITINNVSETALLEELVHAFQYSVNPIGYAAILNSSTNPSLTGASNIEFEAKLLMNLMSNMGFYNGNGSIMADPEFAIMGGINPTDVVEVQGYALWLEDITLNYTKFPTALTTSQLSKYYDFLLTFRYAHMGDPNVYIYSTPANNNLQPSSLLLLTQNTNCKT